MKCRHQVLGVGLFFFLLWNISVRANVYATDILINGWQNAGVIVPGGQITISYILNDNANAGVTVGIFSGTNAVHTVAQPGGSAGTQVGLNSVVWGGTNDLSGAHVPPGVYTVSVTAASTGYSSWTNITDDSTNFLAPAPRGIDVNRNTNSPYYGRVFVGCTDGLYAIVKCNADGSPADEGGISTGGLSWGSAGGPAGYYSPWKIAVAADDTVFIDDLSGNGVVYGFDETITTNAYSNAVRPDNYPPSDPDPYMSGLYATGLGTNAYIWMSDALTYSSAGIIRWQLMSNDVAATGDPGTVIAPVTNGSPLTLAPYDIAVDTNGDIYAIQLVQQTNQSGAVIMCFPPYEGYPETNAEWAVGSGDTNLMDAYGIAVDQTATFVGVAIRGDGDPETGMTGMLNLYYATNGQFITNLDQTGGDQYTDVAWDNVGNLYALDTFTNGGVWRVYSPPGSNQATTVSVPFIQAYNALTPPSLLISNSSLTDVGLSFTLECQSNVTYIIEQSPDLMNWTPVETNYSPFTECLISIPFADNQDFYRAVTSP
ncbi:MAG TPA: hypothetical protein VMR33_10910 [Candidatus Baltobacteraceae bacterium]|nr:hypothetical protein [Candidatus Baltobacteraceae bacterium]